MTIMQDPTASNFAAPMEYVPPQQQHDHDKKKENTYNNNDDEKQQQPPPLPTGVAAIPGVPTQDEDSSRRILLPSIDITNSARSNESRDDPRNNNTGCRFHHNENHNNSNMKKKRSKYDHNNNGNTNHGTDTIDNNGGDDNENVDNDDNNDNDQAERNVAWVIHFCLVFFMGLVLLSIVFTIHIVSKSTTRYAFVTVVVLGIMIVFYIFLFYFVDDTVLSQNQKLRPIRRKIIKVCDTTSMFLHEEYYLFVRDWKQETHNMWLLTADADINTTGTATTRNEEADETTGSSGRHQEQQPQQQNTTKKRSTLFKIIKPFFKLKQKFVVRRTKRNTIHLNQPQ